MDLKRFVRANADRVIAVTLVLLGLVAVVIGWFGASGTGLAVEQIPYLISGGIGGVVLVVVGCAAWASADLQDEWRKLDAIEERLDELVQATRRADPAASEESADSAAPSNGEARGRRRRQPLSSEPAHD